MADLLLAAARDERAAVLVATDEELVAARADRLAAIAPDGSAAGSTPPARGRPAAAHRRAR